ncbi:hypothetical protein [Pseudomonas shirazensis]
MSDFAGGYEPNAYDRYHLLKALIEQLDSPGDASRLRLYDSLIEAAG